LEHSVSPLRPVDDGIGIVLVAGLIFPENDWEEKHLNRGTCGIPPGIGACDTKPAASWKMRAGQRRLARRGGSSKRTIATA
jgi:hypothetical protein